MLFSFNITLITNTMVVDTLKKAIIVVGDDSTVTKIPGEIVYNSVSSMKASIYDLAKDKAMPFRKAVMGTISRKKDKTVVICLGRNDIINYRGIAIDGVFKNYAKVAVEILTKFIREMRVSNRDCNRKFVIASVLPYIVGRGTDQYDVTQLKHSIILNKALRNMCKKESIEFIDTWLSVFIDGKADGRIVSDSKKIGVGIMKGIFMALENNN